jgi:hypothetical protein
MGWHKGIVTYRGWCAGALFLTAAAGLAQTCAGLPAFGPKEFRTLPGTREMMLRVSAKGPALHIRIEPRADWKADPSVPQIVGWIRILSCQTSAPIQLLEVKSFDTPDTFPQHLEARDVNFDGYLDLGVLREFGAKWGKLTWWTFSPQAGKFVSTAFTAALGEVSANGLTLDAQRRRIIAPHLFVFGSIRDVYQVTDDQLTLVHQETLEGVPDPCTVTLHDLVDGQMKTTGVKRLPCGPQDSAK